MNLENRTAIITGAGTGIGRALAQAFARKGANAVVCGRRAQPLEETVALIEKDGGTALAVPTDVTCREEVQRLVNTTLERFGAIDVLFNNAGRFNCLGGVWELDPEDWWLDVTVNLRGPLLCAREVLPRMMERDEGIIINMNGGRPAGGTGYASSKAGLMELTRLMVEELKREGSGVIVFGAGPGLVHTEMTEIQAQSEMGRKWIPSTAEHIQQNKTRRPEDIAEVTMEMIALARPEISGAMFNPSTDVSQFRP